MGIHKQRRGNPQEKIWKNLSSTSLTDRLFLFLQFSSFFCVCAFLSRLQQKERSLFFFFLGQSLPLNSKRGKDWRVRAALIPQISGQQKNTKIREVSHGVGADGVGVKFPIFAVNCCSLPLSFRRSREKRRKRGKNAQKKGKNALKKGKITPTPSTPTPLRTSQKITFCQGRKNSININFLRVPSRPTPGSYPGPVQVPSRVRGGPVQIRHVLCFTVFRTIQAILAYPGPSVPSRIGPGQAETDFLATFDKHKLFGPDFPRTFLTLTPGRPWVKKFLPITGAAEKRIFWCGRPRFLARTSMTRRVFEKLVQKKFALIFWPLYLLGSGDRRVGWGSSTRRGGV